MNQTALRSCFYLFGQEAKATNKKKMNTIRIIMSRSIYHEGKKNVYT